MFERYMKDNPSDDKEKEINKLRRRTEFFKLIFNSLAAIIPIGIILAWLTFWVAVIYIVIKVASHIYHNW